MVLWRSGGTFWCEGTTRRQLAATTRSPAPSGGFASAPHAGGGARGEGRGLRAVGVASPPPINCGARPPASGPAEPSGAERSGAARGSAPGAAHKASAGRLQLQC